MDREAEHALVSRLRAGDADAFDAVYAESPSVSVNISPDEDVTVTVAFFSGGNSVVRLNGIDLDNLTPAVPSISIKPSTTKNEARSSDTGGRYGSRQLTHINKIIMCRTAFITRTKVF